MFPHHADRPHLAGPAPPRARLAPCRLQHRRGAHHGRAPCRPSRPRCREPRARRPQHRDPVRQSQAVRRRGRPRPLSAHRGGRPRKARPLRLRPAVRAAPGSHVSGRLRDQYLRLRPHRRPLRRGPAGAFRRRGDRRHQAVDPDGCGLRLLRREGLPAARHDPPHGPRPRPAGRDRRLPDGARPGRPGTLLAQRPAQPRANARAPRRSIARSRPPPTGCGAARIRAAWPMRRRQSPRPASPPSIMSSCGMRKTWRR